MLNEEEEEEEEESEEKVVEEEAEEEEDKKEVLVEERTCYRGILEVYFRPCQQSLCKAPAPSIFLPATRRSLLSPSFLGLHVGTSGTERTRF